jgi:phage terminase large subunit
VSKKLTYRDNPYFPDVLEKERAYLQRVDPDAYDWVWEGNPKSISDACVFKNKFIEEEFEAPYGTQFFYGADWGFSEDPTTLVRSYILGNHLYIDYESYGIGVDFDEIPSLFSVVPGYMEWRIKADNSRPETISYLRKNHHLRLEACDKWKGSVEDGIAFIRKFEKVHIHQRCKHTLEEFKLYSYKQDSKTQEVLPILIDKHNHCIDSIRYGLDKRIKGGTDWGAVVG